MASVFVLYRDSALRRAALRAPVGDPARYSLYGLDELRRDGFEARHNLEPGFEPGTSARAKARLFDRAVRLAGGYSGDFAGVLGALGETNRADVVFSTVDTVGIPLALLGRFGWVQPPVVYVAIGLPERLEQLRGGRAKKLFAQAFGRLDTIVAYGWGEVEELRSWLGGGGPRVEFVAFGVDVDHFCPDPAATLVDDVVSIGADPRRDFPLVVELARRFPDLSFRVVGSSDNAGGLGSVPANLTLEIDAPFERVRECLLGAKVVALPVRENTYSGATTTLLQALALAKPVVVSRTAAIAQGYGLEDGVNCSLVEPGDGDAFERALLETLADPGQLGSNGRQLVVRELSWQQYTERLWEILSATWARERS